MGINKFYKLVKDGFLDQSLFVDSGGDVFEGDGVLDGFAEGSDELHVHVGFD